MWLGVDVGGTFTDLVLYDQATGRLAVQKVPSTFENQSDAVLGGIERLGIDAGQLERMVHGTTVATNTALEGNGARVVILTTAGHKDVLVVGRGSRKLLYNIKAPVPALLIPRSQCLEIHERLYPNGETARELNDAEVEAIGDQLAGKGIEAVAICFLHSYINPSHEARCAAIIASKLPGVVVVRSSEVLAEYREYERFSTALLNAYVAPRMRHYLKSLEARLAANGLRSRLEVMTSNGGSVPARRVYDLPVLTMLSGPAAGVIAAEFLRKTVVGRDLITCDIGGTSTDVCLVRADGVDMTTEGRVGNMPLKVRQIDINTVAIGGGSIASHRFGSFLAVGPRSAGSHPGPACYGRGGTAPTITDANVVLGRLGTHAPLGGDIHLDVQAARGAIALLATEVGLGIEEMAEGILRIATVGLATAIKEISIMRGYDPRRCALLPYGGAGPLQAVSVAAELGMDTVIIPPLPGHFSALGLLLADIRRDYVQTDISALAKIDAAAINKHLDQLVEKANAEFDNEGFARDRRRFAASLDMRYAGQSFELPVPVGLGVENTDGIRKAFEEIYGSHYGSISDAAIEVVSYRVAAWNLLDHPALPRIDTRKRPGIAAATEHRPVFFDGKAVETPVYQRNAIPLDLSLHGPLLVQEEGSTTVVPQGWALHLDASGCLIIERGKAE